MCTQTDTIWKCICLSLLVCGIALGLCGFLVGEIWIGSFRVVPKMRTVDALQECGVPSTIGACGH